MKLERFRAELRHEIVDAIEWLYADIEDLIGSFDRLTDEEIDHVVRLYNENIWHAINTTSVSDEDLYPFVIAVLLGRKV